MSPNQRSWKGRHALKTPPQHASWPEFLTIWKAADELEVFESAWNWDHFYPLTEPYDGPSLEGWTMLAALAQATTRIRLGSMVNGMHHRHPAVTANMAATLDHISGGRFELGLGAGWNTMESSAYGLDLGSLKERSDRLEEGIEIIISLLENEVTDFSGEHFDLVGARCEPKPIQEHIPIVVGGKGKRRTLRTTARFADQWDMAFPSDPGEWAELAEILFAHCADIGRDPAEITMSIHLPFEPSQDVASQVEAAHPFFDAGVDVVVWSWRGPMSTGGVDSLAAAIAP